MYVVLFFAQSIQYYVPVSELKHALRWFPLILMVETKKCYIFMADDSCHNIVHLI